MDDIPRVGPGNAEQARQLAKARRLNFAMRAGWLRTAQGRHTIASWRRNEIAGPEQARPTFNVSASLCAWPGGCCIEVSALRRETHCTYHGKVAAEFIKTTRADSAKDVIPVRMPAQLREAARREGGRYFDQLLAGETGTYAPEPHPAPETRRGPNGTGKRPSLPSPNPP